MTGLLLPGTIFAERYRVSRAIAKGGFGEVYAAHHLVLDVPVAIKVLRPDRFRMTHDAAVEVDAFLREARLLARMRHPNIVSVLDAGVAPETNLPWMVLAWCEGKTLSDLVASGRIAAPLSPREAWMLLAGAASAVAYAHEQGISHRDLKPANLMFVEEAGGLSARVLDFGIAKATTRTSAAASSVGSMGTAFTPGYAAPEQVAGLQTGPWTDVHALALLFTELITGEAPYEAGSAFLSAVRPERPTPRRFGCDVGGPLEAVLERAMSVDPTLRPPNAARFTAEMNAALAATPLALATARRNAGATVAGTFNPTLAMGLGATPTAGSSTAPPGQTTTGSYAVPTPTIASGGASFAPSRGTPRSRLLPIVGIGGAIAVGIGSAAIAAWLLTKSSTSQKPHAAGRATSASSATALASASSTVAPSAPKSTITFPPGDILKNRAIPSYDEKSFVAAIEHAGYECQLQQGVNASGYKLISVRAKKSPCGGSVQFYDVTASQAPQTAGAMRATVDRTYVVALDPPHVLMVAMDTLENGPNAECTGELVEALTSKR